VREAARKFSFVSQTLVCKTSAEMTETAREIKALRFSKIVLEKLFSIAYCPMSFDIADASAHATESTPSWRFDVSGGNTTKDNLARFFGALGVTLAQPYSLKSERVDCLPRSGFIHRHAFTVEIIRDC
jgi:hypothetical protein